MSMMFDILYLFSFVLILFFIILEYLIFVSFNFILYNIRISLDNFVIFYFKGYLIYYIKGRYYFVTSFSIIFN